MKITRILGWVLVALTLNVAGCQTLREIAALRNVDFAIDRVTSGELAGVDLTRVRSYGDVRAADLYRISSALSEGRLPLHFTLNLLAENPAENSVQARLVELDWTLFLEGRETVSGVLQEDIVLPPGQARTIPVPIQLDLLEFFDRGARDLIELALSVTGQGGAPKEIRLQATPTISTPVGPIRYPEPITIVTREVGSP